MGVSNAACHMEAVRQRRRASLQLQQMKQQQLACSPLFARRGSVADSNLIKPNCSMKDRLVMNFNKLTGSIKDTFRQS